MKAIQKTAIILVLVAAVGIVLAKRSQRTGGSAPVPVTPTASVAKPLPRLVDLGAKKCIPCKMMAPILADLATSKVERLRVEFIDVWENEKAAEAYGINVIPTQIFYDAQGKELFRHEGFFSKEDILGKWKELGFDFSEVPAT